MVQVGGAVYRVALVQPRGSSLVVDRHSITH